ncbi:uncharacterized protein LOC120267280 [Dioscorea cayenensis subsp. rotundata]|uniref:Uncharacterized protein LOC120267280 n=1 Tax=Dioscorea cayennensis subsp. rotundata TaxID=55577 RepID=A0AB40BW53_DIOCR|nr:uncharacterized protein LOC120267280 [Dioscorea cayenensis subsp. rotundata]
MSVNNVFATLNGIPMLNGANFKVWKNKVTLVLGCMDLDYALRELHPAPLTNQSSIHDKRVFERWEWANHIGLMIMQNTIPEAFLDTMTEKKVIKQFLDTLKERFVRSDKAENSVTLRKLVSMRYKDDRNIREYALDMCHLAGKLKGLKIKQLEEEQELRVVL